MIDRSYQKKAVEQTKVRRVKYGHNWFAKEATHNRLYAPWRHFG